MDTFLFTMLLVFAIALGGRDQLLVAILSDRLGRSGQLLALAAVCAALSAALMAWAGAGLAAILPRRAADMLVAFALVAAAFELAWPARVRQPAEPTRSLGAIGIILLARQVGDAARFVVFAFAAQAVYPLVSALGGTLGGIGAIGLGWFAGDEALARFPLRALRLALAAGLFVAALFIGLNARFAPV
jgi:putative Ca2+/H+ antiporter (TMEM165/GDT1 family)